MLTQGRCRFVLGCVCPGCHHARRSVQHFTSPSRGFRLYLSKRLPSAIDCLAPRKRRHCRSEFMNRYQSSDAPENLAPRVTESAALVEPSRREFLAGLGGTAVLTAISRGGAFAQGPESALNLARVAVPTSLTLASENKISALNDGFTPANSLDRSHAPYAIWADRLTGSRTSWVQYDWSEPVNVNKVEVYWAVDPPRPGAIPGSAWPRAEAPESYRILYWNGNDFVPVPQPQGLGVALD